MSLSATDYEKRFGQRFTMNKEKNALGFGVNNAYYPPLKDYKNLNTWIERKIALTTGPPPNPIYLLAIYLQGYATNDSVWDAYYYANAGAAGSQIYPYGIHLFFDMWSLWGYGEYCWEWFINLCWNLSYFLTFFIPIDGIFAGLALNWEPLVQNILFYLPIVNIATVPFMHWWCSVFACELEAGWTYNWKHYGS